MGPSRALRAHSACSSASRTSAVFMVRATRQPTIRHATTSIAKGSRDKSQPSRRVGEIGHPQLMGAGCSELAFDQVCRMLLLGVRHRCVLPCTSGRQPPEARGSASAAPPCSGPYRTDLAALTNRTARSRNSAGYSLLVLVAPSSQGVASPVNQGRFKEPLYGLHLRIGGQRKIAAYVLHFPQQPGLRTPPLLRRLLKIIENQ